MSVCVSASSPITQEVLDGLFAQLTPTGIWADYNPTLYIWFNLKWMAIKGYYDIACLPDQPDPAAFEADTTSAATRELDLGLCAEFGLPTEIV